MKQKTDQGKNNVQGGVRKSMSWLHTWVGLVLSVVLYFMFITGSFGYFNHEIDRWMRPELPTTSALPPANQMVESAAARLQARMPDAKAWYVSFPAGRAAQALSIYGEPKELANGKTPDALEERLDPATGLPFVGVRKTGGGDLLYRMHYSLHYVPYNIAVYIVGLATMFMLIAIATGVVVHKKIFKDFFTFRPAKGQRSWLDAHNLSSVMALPFFVVITYSGLVFYTFDYLPSVKWAAYGFGEQGNKAFERERTANEADVEPSGRAAPLVALAPLVAQAEARWGSGKVAYLTVSHPGDANARVHIEQSSRDKVTRSAETLVFDGTNGVLLKHRSADTHTADDVFASVMLALHEGHFAAPLLRWIYFASGLLGAAMIATGLVLWSSKRRQKLRADEPAAAGLRFVEHFNVGIIVGLPMAVAAYFWANRLLPAAWEARADWEMHVLFITWAMALLHAALRPLQRAWQEQLWATAALFALLPVINAATTRIHLGRTLPAGDWVLVGFDVMALVTAAATAAVAANLHRRGKRMTLTRFGGEATAASGGEATATPLRATA